MAENESFFRKVVRFVANPATDWNELNSRQDDTREMEIEKSELKAMIERKRRNDFVRKREFDMLRKVRREGLSPEQLAALGSSSKMDDSEVRLFDGDSRSARTEGVKAKIDEIEQQMVGEASGFAPAPPPARKPVYFEPQPAREPAPAAPRAQVPPTSVPDIDLGAEVVDEGDRLPALPPLPDPDLPPRSAPPPVKMAGGLPPLAPMAMSTSIEAVDFNSPLSVEVSEVMHDPDLDEAVIAFANADFGNCEQSLQRLTTQGGERHQHAETWLVLFDLYRATGQQPRFESLAIDYAQQFGWSAPQWYSLPKQVADAVAEERPSRIRGHESVGWIAPSELDIDSVARLRSQTLQMPLPWVFDWGGLRRIDTEAAMQLSMLFRLWAGQALEMRWLSGEQLFTVLAEAAPTGVRDADPAFWLTRMDALRLVNRADQFDETAIDYCVTYEVSPPSWEPTRCNVRISGSSLSTRQPAGVDADRAEHRLRRVQPARRHRQRLAGGHGRAVGPAGGRHQRHPERAERRRGHRVDRQRVVHAADPRRLHRRRRPAELGADEEEREPRRALRRCAPPGGAVLRRDGHQRARQGPGAQELIPGPA
jgi:hypothetical protein